MAPAYSSADIIALLKANGFVLKRINGSHHVFSNGPITVVVPHPKKSLPIGTAKAILRQAGI